MQIPEPGRKIAVGTIVSIVALFSLSPSLISRDRPEDDYIRKYYSVNDGLSQNEVTSIIQDVHGFMWFGTRGGLNRFDGYEYLKFKPEPKVNRGLRSPSVETLFPDRQGNIWVGTKSGGLGVYDISLAGFTDSLTSADFPNRIVSFYQDDRGHYWIGSWSGGVYEYHPERGVINHYMNGQRVSSILQTRDGSMWFGTGTGLRYRRTGEQEIRRYNLGEGYNEVTEILESPEDSTIWLVGWNVGLTRFSYNSFTHVTYDLEGQNSRKLNTYSLLSDKEGNLWVGTWGSGLFRFNTGDFSSRKISIYPPGSFKPSLDYDIVLDLFEDTVGDIWVGTDGGGVVRISTSRNFRALLRDQSNEIGSWHVNAVYISDDDELWIGTRARGLYATRDMRKFEFIGFEDGSFLQDQRRYLVKRLSYGPENRLWVSLDNGLFVADENKVGKRHLVSAAKLFNSDDLRQVRKVLDVIEYRGDVWVGTQQDGLYWFQKRERQYHLRKHFHSNDQHASFEDNRISAMVVDSMENLWIGTYKGLYRMDRNDTIPIAVDRLIKDDREFLCDIILSLAVDSTNNIWIGTPCSLNTLTANDDGTYGFLEYTRSDGLTDDYINAVRLSESYTWLSTNAGISRVDRGSGEIRNYDVSDGVYGYNFLDGSSSKSSDGTIYFGGSSDITFFNPKEFVEDLAIPIIAITSFKVMNREVPVTVDGILPVDINEVERITLDHRQKEFSFEIAALDYRSPDNNLYAYRLVGSKGEGDWVYTGQRRHISFSNLRSGEYTLYLAGTNSNGIWNRNGRMLQVKVLPPPWKTGYALIIYIAVILMIVVLINKFSLKQERLKNMAELEHLTRMKDNELNEFKLRFFTDISHELKTPLSLIQAPVEELMNRNYATLNESFFEKRIRLIHSSTIRLTDLLNQLLEFRKVEVGKAVLKASEQDIVKYIALTCESYSFLADNKKIHFHSELPSKGIPLWFEPSKMDVIVNNLLSNAFKYSGTPGMVWLRLTESDEEAVLEVCNDGEGISESEISKLFDRFYQVSGGSHRRGHGSGIGLDLVKRFVEMHRGQIKVESRPNVSTCFMVRFMKGGEHLSEHEKTGVLKEHEKREELPDQADSREPVRSGKIPRGARGAKVLVVEDNDQVREYLIDLLGDLFELSVATDGIAGYASVVEEMPALVLSDVMMPRSDGYELCARIRKNEMTSHIPVILLTAKDGKDEYLTGTRHGADAYITKPFDPALLLEKIKQLISSRMLLKEKYSRKLTLAPLNIEISKEDEKIIGAVMKIIEKHMGAAALDSEFIAAEVNMSASTFYRKMKKTVGQSPGEFIKSMRMKMAARYLRESELTVSEIVERVGYSDIRNFRKSFRDEYGISPAEYRKS